MKLLEVTSVNTLIQVSSVHFYGAWSSHCTVCPPPRVTSCLSPSRSRGCEMLSHGGFFLCIYILWLIASPALICTSLIITDVEHLFMYLLAICMSSWKKSVYDLQPFFKSSYLIFYFWVVWHTYIFWIWPLFRHMVGKYFLPFYRLHFYFVGGFLCYAEAF